MGGFAQDFTRIAAEGLEAAGTKITKDIGEKFEGSYKGFFDPARAFEHSNPVMKSLYEDHKKIYEPLASNYEAQIAQHVSGTGTGTVSPRVKAAVAKMGVAAQDMSSWKGAAKKLASEDVYGPNRQLIQAGLAHTEKVNGKQTADLLSDQYHVMFQEEQPKYAGFTQFQKDMRIKRPNDMGEVMVPKSKYIAPADYEKNVGKFRKLLAWGATPVHAATAALNITNEAGLATTLKAVNQLYGPRKEMDNLLASNSVSELYIQPLRELAEYSGSVVQKGIGSWAPDGVGEFIHKNMGILFLSPVRWHSVAVAAQTGKMMAEEAAFRLSQGDSQYALPALDRLGIDVGDLTKRNFQLNAQDIKQAYWHGANNKVMLNPYDQTPTLWRKSPLFRSIKAFTGYVTKQSLFTRNLFLQQMKQGDYVGIARHMANLTLTAPLVGATIYELDRLRHGADWGHGLENLGKMYQATPAGQIYSAATGQKNDANSARTTFNTIHMLSILGTWGSTTSYIRAANRASLVQKFIPPEMNMALQATEDVMKAGKTDAKHPDAAKPLERDVISAIPVVGGAASHLLIPTRAELNKDKFHKFRRPRPKEDTSWNPFKYNPDEEK